ncbi:interleukin-1 beta [Triplophysa rosa]|uniref:Interleukin-1 n=1 Tax=Triplophysa rosa TaxID=992332 RepID=A0A9W7TBB9_TRIRA|nr:interleukin-1 beta [Triplophysa rosa]KAI7793631.1 interleukin-1 beta [Triplophysa rosa]
MDCEGVSLFVSFENSAFHSDSVLEFDEMDCSLNGRCDLHKAVKVETRTHHHSMKPVVKIVIVMHKMMKSYKQPSESGRHELHTFIMENVLEERVVSSAKAGPRYTKSKVLQCSVCDQYQKTLIRSSGDLRLKAATLKGGNIHQKVQFNLCTYVSPSSSVADSQPVCLGISNSSLYLACSRSDSSNLPKLELREITDTLNTIEANDPMGYDHLLFYRKQSGVAYNTFESVKFPGWFISTTFEDFEEVEVCQQSVNHISSFMLNV